MKILLHSDSVSTTLMLCPCDLYINVNLVTCFDFYSFFRCIFFFNYQICKEYYVEYFDDRNAMYFMSAISSSKLKMISTFHWKKVLWWKFQYYPTFFRNTWHDDDNFSVGRILISHFFPLFFRFGNVDCYQSYLVGQNTNATGWISVRMTSYSVVYWRFVALQSSIIDEPCEHTWSLQYYMLIFEKVKYCHLVHFPQKFAIFVFREIALVACFIVIYCKKKTFKGGAQRNC